MKCKFGIVFALIWIGHVLDLVNDHLVLALTQFCPGFDPVLSGISSRHVDYFTAVEYLYGQFVNLIKENSDFLPLCVLCDPVVAWSSKT